ncbi:DM13 domain-containing protein [Paenibacillus popilliae]|nr:DM13 domain-containing protein [Paenibacillus popilliae]
MKFLGTATVILAISAAALAGCGAANTTTTGSTNATQTSMPKSESPDKVTAIVDEGTKQQTSTMMVKYGILTGTGNEKSEGNVEIKDGKVMLTNFKTAKGPDLHIYLTKGKDVQTGKKLGKIDVDKSEQTFDLAGVNLDDYDSVIVYCDTAQVTFGAADLSDKQMDDKAVSSAMNAKKGVLTGEKSEGDVEIKDGKVMLTNFKTAKGPDLHIYLTKGKDVQTGKKLGKIDVDKSEQTFDLNGANLSEYDSVVIYCDKAQVIFGAADIS